LGDLGGLQEFFLLLGGILVTFISKKLFMASIVRKIYHIRKYENIQDEADKKLRDPDNNDGKGKE
jgi:5-bromo-4-chloroindolyl phosphate hydrolysis protein